MSKYATTVMWLGLFMMLGTVVANWSVIWPLLTRGSTFGQRNGDVVGNPPTQTNPTNGKCPVGYSPQVGPGGTIVCRLTSRLPL